MSGKAALGCAFLLAAAIVLAVAAMMVGWIGHVPSEPPLRTAAVAPAEPSTPPLLLGGWSWRRRSETWVEVSGEVANVSNSPLRVQAVASYYTQDGRFIASDSAMVEYRPLAPGQASPFSITTEWQDGMAVARIAFKEYGGAAIPHADTNEPESGLPR